MTAEYELGEAKGERRMREYEEGEKRENSLQAKKREREQHRKKEEATRTREYELEEKREREDRRKKEEATRRLYEVAQVEEEVKKEKKKKIIGTRFFDPKERRVVDTRRTYLEREEKEEELMEDYFEEVEQPKTAAPRPRQRRKQRPKPTEKIYFEEEKIGPEKKNLRFEIKAEKKPVSQSEEWGSKMWSEIKADEKFGWGEKGVRIGFFFKT